MKYLVAGPCPRPASAHPSAHHPLQVFEKATRIREKNKCDGRHGKNRHAGCMIRPRKATRDAKNPHLGPGELTNTISDLVQFLGNLLPGGLYPVKGLFGAAPQIARNSGALPRLIPQT